MGIGQFRREVQRWLNGSYFSAQQDAESESRMPTDVDPVGIIDQRVVDAVEESLLESESSSGSGANTARTYDIQQQAPLNDSRPVYNKTNRTTIYSAFFQTWHS